MCYNCVDVLDAIVVEGVVKVKVVLGVLAVYEMVCFADFGFWGLGLFGFEVWVFYCNDCLIQWQVSFLKQ